MMLSPEQTAQLRARLINTGLNILKLFRTVESGEQWKEALQ